MNQFSAPSAQRPPDDQDYALPPRRMYLFEPGWVIFVKTGSEREFCHVMTPGQDFYHRLLDGEICVARDEERLCLACAMRRGLIVSEPKRLREAVTPFATDVEPIPLDLDADDDDASSGWSYAGR
jgi:hypothetical protein